MAFAGRVFRSTAFIGVVVPLSASLEASTDGGATSLALRSLISPLDPAGTPSFPRPPVQLDGPCVGRALLLSAAAAGGGGGGSLSSSANWDGGCVGRARLLSAAAAGGGGGSLSSSANWDWFVLTKIDPASTSAQGSSGGAERAKTWSINLDGVVINPPDGFGVLFGGGLHGAIHHEVAGVCGHGPTELEKRNFQLLEFDLQRKLYNVNSKSVYLNLREIVVEAEAFLNAMKSNCLEERSKSAEDKYKYLKKFESNLNQRAEDFERRKAVVNKMDEVIGMLKELLSAAKSPPLEGAKSSKDGDVGPTTKGNDPTSTRLSCKIYLYSKSKVAAYAGSRGPVDHFLHALRKLDGGYSLCRKYYPVVFGAIAWYTSGIEPAEVVDLMHKLHLDNKAKYKKLVTDYREAKIKDAEEAAKAEAEAAKAEAEADAAKNASPDQPTTKKWYFW